MVNKKNRKSINYRVIKKESSEEDSTSSEKDSTEYTTDTSYTQTNSETTSDSETDNGKYQFTSIINSNYKKPKYGSKQDNLTKEEIREKLKGYRLLKTNQDKRYLLKLEPFTVWVRYFNIVKNEFRLGGLLHSVDPQLRYIMLINTQSKVIWSVQIKDNIFFVPKDIEERKKIREEKKQLQKQLQEKEKRTKEKLYKLYKEGKLARR